MDGTSIIGTMYGSLDYLLQYNNGQEPDELITRQQWYTDCL